MSRFRILRDAVKIAEMHEAGITHERIAYALNIDVADVQYYCRDIDGVPKLHYQRCGMCGKADQPFEKKNWNSCIYCMMDIHEHLIEGALAAPKLPNNFRNLIRGAIEDERLSRADYVWRSSLEMEEAELVTLIFDGTRCWNNLRSMTLTTKGSRVLGRVA